MEEDEEQALTSIRCRQRHVLLLVACHPALQNEKWFRNLLTLEERQRRDRNLPRCSLLDPDAAPWEQVHTSEDNGALIAVTGMDLEAFADLLVLFTPCFDNCTPWTGKNDGLTHKRVTLDEARGRGKKRIVKAHSCLAPALDWCRFRGGEFTLQGWFGFTDGHANAWLRFGWRMPMKCLIEHPLAKFKFPADDDVDDLNRIEDLRHPALDNVCCTADGCKLHVQSCAGLDEQNVHCNGWLHSHFATNSFVFGADGRIIDAVINVPGSVHDSTLAIWGITHTKLGEVHKRTKGVCCVDSAFASNPNKHLIQSAQDCRTKDGPYMDMQGYLDTVE